jgi:hypothetical protein
MSQNNMTEYLKKIILTAAMMSAMVVADNIPDHEI